MTREMSKEAKAILALDGLAKDLEREDMPTDAKDTRKLLRTLINQTLQYVSRGDLKTDDVYICEDCSCLFDPWDPDDSCEHDCCRDCSVYARDYDNTVKWSYENR